LALFRLYLHSCFGEIELILEAFPAPLTIQRDFDTFTYSRRIAPGGIKYRRRCLSPIIDGNFLELRAFLIRFLL
jgi:hypothetical protein